MNYALCITNYSPPCSYPDLTLRLLKSDSLKIRCKDTMNILPFANFFRKKMQKSQSLCPTCKYAGLDQCFDNTVENVQTALCRNKAFFLGGRVRLDEHFAGVKERLRFRKQFGRKHNPLARAQT